MDGPITLLGIVFVLLIVAENFSEPSGDVKLAFDIATYILGAVFVAEFAVRVTIAPSTSDYLRRNWWQIILLVLPFLRFARVLSRLGFARAGGMASSAVRVSHTSRAALTGRAAWLAGITVVVILAASQVLFDYARGGRGYDEVLHAVALTTVTGEPLHSDEALAQGLEILLGIYQVVVFATLAGMVGAFFLEKRAVVAPARKQAPSKSARH